MTYIGMHTKSGRQISDLDHLHQSVSDILFTPIGSRVMRREYGSLLLELIDHPQNAAMRLKLVSAAVMALMRWEPRLKLSQLQVSRGATPSQLVVDLIATRTTGPQAGQRVQLSVNSGVVSV